MAGQTTPSQPPTQVPVWQIWPALQVTPSHDGSTQRPFTQTAAARRGTRWSLQGPTHFPCTQTWPVGQSPSPSSTIPLQSLSRLSHFSALGLIVATQVGVPPTTHWVMPFAQTPCMVVWQGTPPPSQVTPVMAKTLSLKSPSFPNQVVVLAPSQSSQAM